MGGEMKNDVLVKQNFTFFIRRNKYATISKAQFKFTCPAVYIPSV